MVTIETTVTRLAHVLCWLAIDPRQSVTPETVWRDMSPEVRQGFRDKARLVIERLGGDVTGQ